VKIEVKESNRETLELLYSRYKIRAKEIGSIFGVSESAILLKLKKFEIPKLSRCDKRSDVVVVNTGKVKRSQELTPKLLRDLCSKGMSDKDIGNLYGMTGEGVAYKRNKEGIAVSDKNKMEFLVRKAFEGTPKGVLEEDYLSLTTEEMSDKYKVSKTVWLPHIRSLGIKSKEVSRIESYPDATDEQLQILIGSMLGDGGIKNGRYREYHSSKQKEYLKFKRDKLRPFSIGIHPDGPGWSFRTATLPLFKSLESLFYKEGVRGKYIPVDYIKSNWHESILAYWFLDDGTYDDINNELFIFNLCPDRDQLESLLEFINEREGLGLKSAIRGDVYSITCSVKYFDTFFPMIKKYATADLLYKIPEKYLSAEDVSSIPAPESVSSITPKLYRLMSRGRKAQSEGVLFNYYRERGFPFSSLTEDRSEYLFNIFRENAKSKPSVEDSVVKASTVGLGLLDSLFPNIYKATRGKGPSIVDQWDDDAYLMKLVKNRLKHADRINDASFRKGSKLISSSVSNFRPAAAAAVYKEFNVNGRIFDYSAGFGSRMLAALSLGYEYCAYEPNTETFDNLQKMGSWIKGLDSSVRYEVRKQGSEEEPFKEDYFGLAFSSPPYFDLERYSEEPTQSIVKYPSKESWLKGYWEDTIENCKTSLISGGMFVVCLSPYSSQFIIDYTYEACDRLGLQFVEKIDLPFAGVFHKEKRSEYILVFKK